MHSCDEKIVVKVEVCVKPEEFSEETEEYVGNIEVKKEPFFVKTEKFDDYTSADDNFKVKSEYNEYHGQCTASQGSKIKLESDLLDDAQEVLQRKQASSLVAEHLVKIENITFECRHCLEEFSHEQEYNAHMSIHLQSSDGDSKCRMSQVCAPRTAVSSGWDSAHIEHKRAVQSLADSYPSTIWTQPSVYPLARQLATKEDAFEDNKHGYKIEIELHKQSNSSFINNKDIKTLRNCTVELCDIFKTREGLHKCIISNRVNVDTLSEIHCQTSKNVLVTQNNYNKKCFTCDICRKMFKYKKLLINHIKSHTDKIMFSCKHCQYKSIYKHSVVRHTMQIHTGEKRYSCNLCKYRCVQKGSLENHMRIHTGEKPFSCELCDFKCARYSSLARHIQVHNGEKPYACHLCEYKFTQNCHLVSHMRTHTGEKPYLCKVCDFKSANKGTLVVHMRTHTGEKPFYCTLCEYKCTAKRTLKRHMITHTKKNHVECCTR